MHANDNAHAYKMVAGSLLWYDDMPRRVVGRKKTRDANAATATYPGRSLIWALVRNVGTPTEPKNIGWGDSTVTGSANSDVNLFKPQTEARTAGTSTMSTTTQLADTYKVTGSITCLVGAKTITEAGLFDTTTLSPSTTIATSSLAAASTSVTLAAASGITTGNYYRQIENECVLVTGGQNTTTETIVRAQLGSTSAAHATGVATTVGGDGGASKNATLGGGTATVTAAQGGSCFAHADFAGVSLSVNDSISFSWADQLS